MFQIIKDSAKKTSDQYNHLQNGNKNIVIDVGKFHGFYGVTYTLVFQLLANFSFMDAYSHLPRAATIFALSSTIGSISEYPTGGLTGLAYDCTGTLGDCASSMFARSASENPNTNNVAAPLLDV